MSGIVNGHGGFTNSGTIGGAEGQIISTKSWTWLDGNLTFTDGNGRIGKEFVSHVLNPTNTYTIHVSCWVGAAATGSTTERRTYPKVHMHDADPGNPGDIFSGGTMFISGLIGRVLVSSSSTAACSYGLWTSTSVVPYGTGGTRYFGITCNSDGATNTATIYASGNSQLNFVINEYKGDVDIRAT